MKLFNYTQYLTVSVKRDGGTDARRDRCNGEGYAV